MQKFIRWALLLIVLVPVNGFAGPFSEIVVFGDSLSDNGNLLFFDQQPKPDPEFYYDGRLSNGPVWAEYLAESGRLDAPLTDVALAGARTEGLVPPGLFEQVSVYIAAQEFSLSAGTLYVIWIGGNDFLNGDGDSQAAVNNINEAMADLADAGAMHILVLNLPDLGAIPDTLGTAEAPPATAFTVDFNSRLAAVLDQFSLARPGVGLYSYNIYALFESVQADPTAYGFINASAPAPNYSVPNNFDGGGYVFWDDIHPTTAMHAEIADQVYDDLNAQLPATVVPESDGGGGCFIDALRLQK